MKNKSLTALVIVIFILGFIQILVSNHLSTLGKKIALIELEEKKISEENEVLETRIASASSLLSINKKAATLGFNCPALVLNLGKEAPIAVKRTLVNDAN